MQEQGELGDRRPNHGDLRPGMIVIDRYEMDHVLALVLWIERTCNDDDVDNVDISIGILQGKNGRIETFEARFNDDLSDSMIEIVK